MEYRTYKGRRTAALGFGGMRFEDPDNIEKSAETVLRAYELGITYFDTAPGYCKDKSEIIMGEAIKEMKKGSTPFTISTKSSRADGGELREQLETSLKRLNVDTIDYFNCWYVLTKKDWENRKKKGAVQAILKAKEEGLIRHAVFSTHLPGPHIREVIEEGYFEGVTLGYSIINFPFRQEGIEAASQRDMGVVVMNPLGGGVIPQNEDRFGFLKSHKDQNMVDAALHFLLSDPRITVSLVGFRNIADVESAVASVDKFKSYSDDQISRIKNRVETEFNELCTSCMYCNVCPEDIPVWSFMESWNNLKLRGSDAVGDRIKYHWGTDISELDKCTGCLKCERACTQKLPILERFEDLKKAVRGA